jgi:hypothetical protein
MYIPKSQPTPPHYQITPLQRKRSIAYREAGWKTIDGYLYEADKLARCIDYARKHYFPKEFTFFVSLNILNDLSDEQMKSKWKAICRRLERKRIIAIYITEVSRETNRFNFHLILRNKEELGVQGLKALIKGAACELVTNVNVKAYDGKQNYYTLRYITKAKTPKYVEGHLVSNDRWESKRALFNSATKLRKYGVIGKFWPPKINKKIIWSQIIANEKRIKEGLSHPLADAYAQEIFELIGGYYSLQKVKRSVGYYGVPDGWIPWEIECQEYWSKITTKNRASKTEAESACDTDQSLPEKSKPHNYHPQFIMVNRLNNGDQSYIPVQIRLESQALRNARAPPPRVENKGRSAEKAFELPFEVLNYARILRLCLL